MVRLTNSVAAWGSSAFAATLKAELEQLRSDVLPLAHAVAEGSRLDDSDLGIILNEVSEEGGYIYAKIGVFFAEVVSCLTCSGGDGMCDEAYCELIVAINKQDGEASFKPL